MAGLVRAVQRQHETASADDFAFEGGELRRWRQSVIAGFRIVADLAFVHHVPQRVASARKAGLCAPFGTEFRVELVGLRIFGQA